MNLFRIFATDVSEAVGSVSYLHSGKEIASGAFEQGKDAALSIELPRFAGATAAKLSVFSESGEHLCDSAFEYSGFDLLNDTFLVNISALKLPVGLYFASIEINTVAGMLHGVKGNGRNLHLSHKEDGGMFQFSVVSFKYPSADNYLGGIIYHVFVDRFSRGGNVPLRSDAILNEDWDNGVPEYPEYPGAHLENNTFFGGTLYGVIDKLDYIKSLGVSLIYLSPIFEAYSNHKYDTGNYMRVDEMFGGDEALIKLINEAASRGIGIILDGVFNHTGSDSIYFNKNGRYSTVGAYQSTDSPFYPWFDFKSHPDDYTCWWNIKILPRINPDIKECGDYLAGDGGVVEKYASLGIAGFRLDVADELSDSFISRIKSKLSEFSSQSLLYGEVWEDASNKIAYGKRKRYYLGSELDGVMNYPVRTGIIEFIAQKNYEPLRYALTDVTFNAPKRIRDMQMNLLGSHDTERILTLLAGANAAGKTNEILSRTYLTEDERKKGIRRLKMAYTVLATLPGIPSIYYGDEAGMEGFKDPFNRRPFPWNNIEPDLLAHYRMIGDIRTSNAVYRDGEFKLSELNEDLLCFARIKGKECYYTLVNNSDRSLTVKFGKRATDLFSGDCALTFALPYECAKIYKTSINNTLEFV